MFPPFILFLGLTVATAVIAYWSDNLGKKLGKKRVSLMGLRPRTTATILTISSSWAIMLFTLVMLLAVVTPLRHALFYYDSERTRYNSEIDKAKTRLSETRDRLAQTQSSLLKSGDQLKTSQSDLKKAKSATKRADQQAKRADQGAKQAQLGEKRAQAGAKSAQKLADAAGSRAKAAQSREKEALRGEKEAELLTQKAQLALQNSSASLAQVQLDLGTTQSKLRRSQTQLGRVETQLNSAKSSLFSVGGALHRLGPETLRLSRQTLDLTRQRDALQQQIADLETAAQIYQQAALQLAGGNVSINIGRTFAARIIEAGEPAPRIEAQLREILAQGQKDFAEKPETSPLFQNGARLILLQLPERGTNNAQVFRELSQLIANNGASKNAATSVRLVAKFNFTAEEKQIAVQFVAVPVAVAFQEGETLASATIDSSGGDAGVFRALNNLIETAREAAIKRGVNPPLSPDEQTFYADGTNVELFSALRRIEASRGSQRVSLVAAAALSTVEPLRVRFEVRAASS